MHIEEVASLDYAVLVGCFRDPWGYEGGEPNPVRGATVPCAGVGGSVVIAALPCCQGGAIRIEAAVVICGAAGENAVVAVGDAVVAASSHTCWAMVS